MRLRYSFVVREVAGMKVAVAVGADHEKFNGMVKLNDTGAFIFERLSEQDGTIDTLAEKLTEQYDVTREVAVECVQHFVQSLRDSDLIDE